MRGKKVRPDAMGLLVCPRRPAGVPGIVALSLRQPWAALVVHGLKLVEIRPWRTSRRGLIWIHAARTADPRRRVWQMVPPALEEAAGRFGGIVGVAELVDCLQYASPQAFARDQSRHLNEPAWFRQPPLYGLVFAHARPVPFWPHRGHVRFFHVGRPPQGKESCPSFW